MEIGRTTTISNSSDPLWATEFHLPEDLLLGTRTPSKTGGISGGGVGAGKSLAPSRPPSRKGGSSVNGVVALEVWDRVPEGDPVLLGAVDVPSEVVQEMMSSSYEGQKPEDRNARAVRSSKEKGGGDYQVDGRGETTGISSDSSGLHLLNLYLGTFPKKKLPPNQQVACVESGDKRMAGEKNGGTVGVLSLSLKRVVTAVKPSAKERPNNPEAMPEDDLRLSPLVAKDTENVAKLGADISKKRGGEVDTYIVAW